MTYQVFCFLKYIWETTKVHSTVSFSKVTSFTRLYGKTVDKCLAFNRCWSHRVKLDRFEYVGDGWTGSSATAGRSNFYASYLRLNNKTNASPNSNHLSRNGAVSLVSWDIKERRPHGNRAPVNRSRPDIWLTFSKTPGTSSSPKYQSINPLMGRRGFRFHLGSKEHQGLWTVTKNV